MYLYIDTADKEINEKQQETSETRARARQQGKTAPNLLASEAAGERPRPLSRVLWLRFPILAEEDVSTTVRSNACDISISKCVLSGISLYLGARRFAMPGNSQGARRPRQGRTLCNSIAVCPGSMMHCYDTSSCLRGRAGAMQGLVTTSAAPCAYSMHVHPCN